MDGFILIGTPYSVNATKKTNKTRTKPLLRDATFYVPVKPIYNQNSL